jgi:hypothetical protein
MSNDRGLTWTSIVGNLPDRHVVWSVVEDHVNPDLLFVGTEFGLFFTVDGGRYWVQLKSGAPTAQFRDLTLQRRENDLVAATFGRGFYVLDDYTVLRYLDADTLAQEGVLFRPRGALVYEELGYVIAAYGNFTTPNPPFGATLHYHLRDGLAENNAKIMLMIEDAEGEPVRRITGPKTAGLHRVVWDLRHAPVEQETGRGRRRSRPGPLVEPGKYAVTLKRVVEGSETKLGKSQTVVVESL